MKRTAFDGFVLLLPLTALAGILAAVALVNPTAVVRAMLPVNGAGTAEPVVAAAQTARHKNHFRLTSASSQQISPVTGGRPLQAGDRITISTQDGGDRVYSVRTISEIEVPLKTAAQPGFSETSRMQLVTCENVGDAHAPPLRFIVEGGRTSAPAIGSLSHPQPL
jgi:hypothetical protein